MRKRRFLWDLSNVTSGLIRKSVTYKIISRPLIFICDHQIDNRFIFGISTTFTNLVVFEKLLCMFRKWRHYKKLSEIILLVTIILNQARVSVPNSVYKTKKSMIVWIQQASKNNKKIYFRKTSKIIYITLLQYTVWTFLQCRL